ncbi:hypothetical protein ACCO45_009899 [Purpureocillium lilacinum]|uniref:Uncharacterized protein n=1 Tax=Purpureocillium lilacinum TaxID=33203 RepID=A0ACC4DKM0_PURLI
MTEDLAGLTDLAAVYEYLTSWIWNLIQGWQLGTLAIAGTMQYCAYSSLLTTPPLSVSSIFLFGLIRRGMLPSFLQVSKLSMHLYSHCYMEYNGPGPDVWFEPQEVWEMAFADITLSPTYTAAIGLVSDERGLSLRFPRFLKKREDKGIEEASTNEFLAGL